MFEEVESTMEKSKEDLKGELGQITKDMLNSHCDCTVFILSQSDHNAFMINKYHSLFFVGNTGSGRYYLLNGCPQASQKCD